MDDLKNILDDEQLASLEEAFDEVLNESEKTLATAMAKNAEKAMEHEARTFARALLKFLIWHWVSRLAPNERTGVEEMIDIRRQALNAVNNLLKSAAGDKERQKALSKFERALKAQLAETNKIAKRTDYETFF